MAEFRSRSDFAGQTPHLYSGKSSALDRVVGDAPLLRGISPAAAARRGGGLLPWQARRIVGYIEANLDRTIRVNGIAGLIGLSQSHFARAFKLTFQDTPYRYVLRRRMEKAKLLMRQSSEPLAQIALDVGCSDQAHFCRLFHSQMYLSPSEWRREACAGGLGGGIETSGSASQETPRQD